MRRFTTAIVSLLVGVLLASCAPRVAQAPPAASRVETRNASGVSGEPLKRVLAVGAPCGVAMAYKEAREAFQRAHPGVTFASHIKNISPMTRELRDGKVNLDVFLSLGEQEAETLVRAGVVAGAPVPFLKQSMQLMVQLGNPLGIHSLEDLAKPEVRTVAICSPDLTIGDAGEKALRSAGVWDKLSAGGKVVRFNQPAQAKGMVVDKQADATFIYAACSTPTWVSGDPERSVTGKADVVMTVPDDLYGGMHATAVVMKGAKTPQLARQFVDFLLTPAAQAAVAKWGYGGIDTPSTPPADK